MHAAISADCDRVRLNRPARADDWVGMARRALLLTLLALLLAPSSAGASTLQVRANGRVVCSGTLVSAQYVLTARHCVRRAGGRRIRARWITVVARKGAVRLSRVASVRDAPRRGRRQPDLTLLQLTSRSTLEPTRTRRVKGPMRSGRVRTIGWRDQRTLVTHTGRLIARRRCGAFARRTRALCAALPARPPARNCRDAAGAGLLRGRALIGVGTRSRRGCAPRPRAAYTRLDRRAIAWIDSVLDPRAPAGFFVGDFRGPILQDNEGQTREYPARISLGRDGPPGTVLGTSDYPTLPCGGELTLRERLPGGGVVLREQLTYGTDRCIDGGTVTLTRVDGRDAITYSWTRAPADGRSSGVLARRSKG